MFHIFFDFFDLFSHGEVSMLGLLFCFICCFIIYGVFCFYPQAKLQLFPDFSKYFDHKITNYFPEHQSIRF